MQLYTGVVENRHDPLKLGRCQVRVVGLHNYDKGQLPTSDLPWAYPIQPITSAAMSGIGSAPVGPVEGTWVVLFFRDEDEQQPIIMGTLGGIPQSVNGTVDEEDTNTVVLKSEKDPETSVSDSKIVSSNGKLVDQAKDLSPQEQAQNLLSPGYNQTDITTEPPEEFTSKRELRKQSIVAILKACDDLGVTTREAKCSILAMAGGESGFLPSDEGYNYSADALKSVFYTTFTKKNPDLVNDYARAPSKGISREDFFNFVYSPENNGAGLGNIQPDDGGKYYGRGLTGITGRWAYDYYGSKIGVNLLNNPDLLNSDLNISAKASVAMITDKTQKRSPNVSNTANPGYFYAVKKAQGNDANAEAAERRLRYYEYFYGSSIPTTYTQEKSASTLPPANTMTEIQSIAGPMGFKDPDNKYPLKKFINEPDTNRLARGIKIGTVHPIRDSVRAQNIPIGLSDKTFSEPTSTYAAKYPFNHVFETESGHVQEFDDTPGHERIHLYHRKGTYTEIDPNGTQINHIVGDGYHIYDRNGSIYVAGNANLTVTGNIHILCQSVANVEVTGDANVQVGGNADIGVAKNVNLAVGDSMNVQIANTLNIKATDINIEASNALNLKSTTMTESASTINLNAGTYRETSSTSYYRHNSDTYTYHGGNTYLVAASGKTDYGCPTTRSGAESCPNVASASSAPAVNPGLIAPANGIVEYSEFPFLETPPSEGEELFLIETEEEWNSDAGVAKQQELVKELGPAPTDVQGKTTPLGGLNKNIVVGCDLVNGMTDFTNTYQLSPNFTLGMLIDGGVNGHNRLVDQNGLTKQEIVCNLKQLCINILEPMLAVLPSGIKGYGKQWKINSGYRIASNIPAGGVSKSDHMTGRAVDFTLLPYDNTKSQRNFELASTIEKILPYDQLIMEYMSGGSNWIHISYRGIEAGDTSGGGINRKVAFTMSNGSTIRQNGLTGLYLLG